MDARKPLQDSDLPDSRLLARLLQASVLVLDEDGSVLFASPGACELLGAAGEADLRERWTDIGMQLRVGDWPAELPDGAAYYARADVHTPAGLQPIRFEVHRLSKHGLMHSIVLLR